ncbi:SDR family NAD(P)-dependent oxidoreductase [Bauldia sp.]|uniref:SDR family NAD(P)-dependent oxidoreductase n=1 Tax=Bauldia sp. TaxID=2575872 RepID=UPI003BAA2C4E
MAETPDTDIDTIWRTRYGPVAVVTGASDGIGREMAIALAGRGLDLVVVARRADRLEALAAELEQQYRVTVTPVVADLATPAGIQATITAADGLDVGLLAASAGFGTSGAFVDANLAAERQMVAVNCLAVMELTHHFGRRLAERGRGGLILMSSLVAFQGVPNAAHYAATKAYVQSLAEGLAVELSGANVDVLAVAPGPTASGFAERADMRMGATVTAKAVALGALEGLGRRTVVRPGFLSKALEASLALLPRRGRVRMLGKVMGGMTQHQHDGQSSEAERPARSLSS